MLSSSAGAGRRSVRAGRWQFEESLKTISYKKLSPPVSRPAGQIKKRSWLESDSSSHEHGTAVGGGYARICKVSAKLTFTCIIEERIDIGKVEMVEDVIRRQTQFKVCFFTQLNAFDQSRISKVRWSIHQGITRRSSKRGPKNLLGRPGIHNEPHIASSHAD